MTVKEYREKNPDCKYCEYGLNCENCAYCYAKEKTILFCKSTAKKCKVYRAKEKCYK